MYAETLKAIAKVKHLNQSDLARAAGVSRQRVSQWFQEVNDEGYINTQIEHARALAVALQVDIGTLVQKLPLMDDQSRLKRETTRLLWDQLYPDLVSLLIAAMDGERDALARIVQVYGLYEAAKLLGGRVWREFPRYKGILKPARRIQLEALWQYRQIQMKA